MEMKNLKEVALSLYIWVHPTNEKQMSLKMGGVCDCLCWYVPLQPPGPFSSGRRTGFESQAVQSSQTDTPEPEQASSGSTYWAWLDSCRSWGCGWRSPSGGSGYLEENASSVQLKRKRFPLSNNDSEHSFNSVGMFWDKSMAFCCRRLQYFCLWLFFRAVGN